MLERLKEQVFQANLLLPKHGLVLRQRNVAAAPQLGQDATAARRSGLTADLLLAILFELELGGRVACQPGGSYQRLD